MADADELEAMGRVTLRAAQAWSARAIATQLREHAVLANRQADELEEQARLVESGTLTRVPRPEPAVEADKQPLVAYEDGTDLSPEMVKFVERFHTRFRSSPHFAQAINEAAAAGLFLDDGSARWVAERVQVLDSEASGSVGRPEIAS